MIETRLMQYFLAVAKEQGHIAKQQKCCTSQYFKPGKMLEKEIGATSFIKGSRPLSLTNEGYL